MYIDRAVREGKAYNVKEICLIPGEKTLAQSETEEAESILSAGR